MEAKQNVLMWSGMIIEVAGVIMLLRAVSTDGSPTTGILFLTIGLFFMLLGIFKAR